MNLVLKQLQYFISNKTETTFIKRGESRSTPEH